VSTTADGFVTVARVGEIPEGGVKLVRVDDQTIAVFHIDGEYHAIDDICTHDGGPLAEGEVEGDQVICPRHGARFSIKSGAALTFPAITPVQTYPVRVDGEDLLVGIAD